jgi:cell wall assembly regulator SMI1
LAALEVAFGRTLPADVSSFYAIADGDGPAIEGEEHFRGLLLGPAPCADWIRAMRWLSAADARTVLFECRDTLDEAFRSSWLPVATDDLGNVAVVDADAGTLFAIDHEDPRAKKENRIAESIGAYLSELARDVESGAVECDRDGFFRGVATPSTSEPAAVLLALLVEQGMLELAPGSSMAEAVAAVRPVLASVGSTKALAKQLGEVLESASWVDETFASQEVLELLVAEFR